MIPREIFLIAMERKETPRVPFVETSIAFDIGQKLLGRRVTPLYIPQLGLEMRNVEDEKALSRLLHRDNISFRFTAPTFSEKPVGKDDQPFATEFTRSIQTVWISGPLNATMAIRSVSSVM